MNKYVVKKIVNKIINNIDKYTASDVMYSENKYILPGSVLFDEINIPSSEMIETIIDAFNDSKFSEDNNIEISFKETFDGKKHLFAWFK